MTLFVEHALQAIESPEPSVVAEGFLHLAEVVAVNRIQNFRSDVIPEANEQVLEWGPLEEIQRRVKDWITRHPRHASAASAFWVLDKFHDPTLVPFLRKWLAHYVDEVLPALGPLGQILVDLGSLGEPAISGNSFSADDCGKNLTDAIRYLRAIEAKHVQRRS